MKSMVKESTRLEFPSDDFGCSGVSGGLEIGR
jgi:hypothetical protein